MSSTAEQLESQNASPESAPAETPTPPLNADSKLAAPSSTEPDPDDATTQPTGPPPAAAEDPKPAQMKDNEIHSEQVEPPNLETSKSSIHTDEPANHSDPKSNDSEDPTAQSNVAESNPKLRKGDGNRTFTMRELLNELKNGGEDSEAREAGTPYRFLLSLPLISIQLH